MASASQRRVRPTKGFNFTSAMRPLIEDMIRSLPELRHIDLNRVALSFAQTRKRSRYGIHATLTPMRFENGASTTVKHGVIYKTQRFLNSKDQDVLYILTFYLPRFMETNLQEKLVTILHELWHISPHFDGDIRRHPGRCYAHTTSQKEYDAHMAVLAKRWLDRKPPDELFSFLNLNFVELNNQYGGVFGTKVRTPKLIPVRNAG